MLPLEENYVVNFIIMCETCAVRSFVQSCGLLVCASISALQLTQNISFIAGTTVERHEA